MRQVPVKDQFDCRETIDRMFLNDAEHDSVDKMLNDRVNNPEPYLTQPFAWPGLYEDEEGQEARMLEL